jgi:hypothetical protein
MANQRRKTMLAEWRKAERRYQQAVQKSLASAEGDGRITKEHAVRLNQRRLEADKAMHRYFRHSLK